MEVGFLPEVKKSFVSMTNYNGISIECHLLRMAGTFATSTMMRVGASFRPRKAVACDNFPMAEPRHRLVTTHKHVYLSKANEQQQRNLKRRYTGKATRSSQKP